MRISSRPVVLSHTGLNTRLGNDTAVAKIMLQRLISEAQAKMVADAENLRAMVNVAGIDHVCIGTDTKIAQSATTRRGGGTNRAWQEQEKGFFYSVHDALTGVGFSPREIEQIAGENFLRTFKAATENTAPK